MAITCSPRAIKASTTWDPMKPAAPVTATGPDSGIGPTPNRNQCNARVLERPRVQHVATIDNQHTALQSGPIECQVLGMIRLENGHIHIRRAVELDWFCT